MTLPEKFFQWILSGHLEFESMKDDKAAEDRAEEIVNEMMPDADPDIQREFFKMLIQYWVNKHMTEFGFQIAFTQRFNKKPRVRFSKE